MKKIKNLQGAVLLLIILVMIGCTSNTTKPPVLQGIDSDQTEITILIGESIWLNVIPIPEKAKIPELVWSSSDENVAIVKDGEVKAMYDGTSHITATTSDGDHTLEWFVTVEYIEPEYLTDHMEEIFEIVNKRIGIDELEVRIWIFDRYSILITGLNSYQIETCVLYIDNEEIPFTNAQLNRFFSNHCSFERGKLHDINLIANSISYRTIFQLPSIPTVYLPEEMFNPKKEYTFTWELDNDFCFQFMNVAVYDTRLATEMEEYFLLEEISPSERSYTIKPRTIHSDYIFAGVSILGINYITKDRSVFLSDMWIITR